MTVSGAALLEAVAVMDRLRGPGGCPWDAEQTPTSLLRYLVEETYELYDAVAAGDRAAVREELGDVLLQVLFHARMAAEDPDGFDVDDVARDLVAKLVARHPHVFGVGEAAEVVATAGEQNRRWEELKATEKRRESVLDGVALAQPGAALLAKYVTRARRGGVPEDLLRAAVEPSPGLPGAAPDGAAPDGAGGGAPDGAGGGAPDGAGGGAPAAVVAAALAGDDPEGVLRAAATGVAARIRAAEAGARAVGETLGPGAADTWRRHWPTG